MTEHTFQPYAEDQSLMSWAGEMVQLLRVHVAFTEDPVSSPSSHRVTTIYFQYPLLTFVGTAHSWHTHVQAKVIHIEYSFVRTEALQCRRSCHGMDPRPVKRLENLLIEGRYLLA